MKTILSIIAFMAASLYASAQGNNATPSTEPPAPLIILKNANQKFEIDPLKGEFLNDSAIKKEGIASVDIVSAETATDLYGERGLNGAIVITLKDEYFITKESVLRLEVPVE